MGRTRREIPMEPGLGSPLDAAVNQRDRAAVAMARAALDRDDVALAFQPVIRAAPPHGTAFHEGLLRLMDETGRIIPAADFMAAVETHELGRLLDCAALSLGLRTLAAQPDLRLSINMSARSVGYPRFTQILRQTVRRAPDVAERLILEITEGSAMLMPELVVVFMADFAEHGITFALDDFGAGHTAFRHLKDFSFEIVKIDGGFVRNVATDPDNQVLCAALMSVAHHFDMLAVAEHVEAAEDAAWLVRAGIGGLQGYLYGAPTLRPPWQKASVGTRRAG